MSMPDVVSQISDWVVMVGTGGALALIWKLRAAQVDVLKERLGSLHDRVELAEAKSYPDTLEAIKAVKDDMERKLEEKNDELVEERAKSNQNQEKIRDLECEIERLRSAEIGATGAIRVFESGLRNSQTWDEVVDSLTGIASSRTQVSYCKECGKIFIPSSPDSVYCSSTCRNKAAMSEVSDS
jgi:hypothetical protein